MILVNICTILMNESDTDRQTIAWNPDDGMLYNSAAEEPCDGYKYESFEDAVKACEAMWGGSGIVDPWALEWQSYRILPDYYDFWGADAENNMTTAGEIVNLAGEWEKSVDDLMRQVELP